MPDLSSILETVGAGGARGTDVASLIQHAHWVVKGVMGLLAAMFLIGVYIIIYKALYVRRAARESAAFTDSFWRSRDIEQIYKNSQALRNSPVSQMFLAGYTELAKLASDERMKGDHEGKLQNIERALRKAQTTETTKLESMVPFLATTGASAPFIGLFGTIFGIMNSFQDLGSMKSATLDVVAPGIAEALFATAVGLIAAIPSVIAYNYFVRRIKVLRSDMENFEQDYLNIIKRHFLH
ncbi:MAG: protein TolQ [Myxococcales bacterium]|nr:protein TolQ [Myxococcales bacterium]